MSRFHLPAILLAATLLTSCGSVSIDLPADIGADFDLDAVLTEMQDCDALSEAFVEVVTTAAAQADALAEASGGAIEPLELREKVEAISVSQYFGLAEQIGCRRLQLQAQTIDQLSRLDPEGSAGQELIEVILDQVQQAG